MGIFNIYELHFIQRNSGLNAFSLSGKRALVTGGGTGIGRGITKAFVDAGASVIITGRREALLLEAASQLGPSCSYIRHDLTEMDTIPGLIQHIEDEHGPIDILVNNAGVHLKKDAVDTSDEEFLGVLQTNLLSVFALTRECARNMMDRRRGSIILIHSMTGIFGMPKVVAYGTSKTALTGLMNNLVTEFSDFNVRINAIAPGWIESDMMLNAIEADQERKRRILSRIAMPHFGQPEDIGYAAVYLASDASRYVTGVVLPVDGGATANL